MTIKTTSRWICSLALAFLVSSCAYPISEVYRREARTDIDFSTVLSNPAAYSGTVVIWGGEIIRTVNTDGQSEITVLQTPLDGREMPMSDVHSQGRFIVKDNHFLDPVVYAKGRKITVAGVLAGAEQRTLGRSAYNYPLINADEIHLWEKSTQPVIVNNYGYGDDFDAWWGPEFHEYYRGDEGREGHGGQHEHDFDRDRR